MSDQPASQRQGWTRRMVARSGSEEHRAATPLELFFDLCFVVAVGQNAARLHHALSEGHIGSGILSYLMIFFAIWWAWMNFTWFASAYDCDDALYRLMVLVQIAGVLIVAAAVPRAFDEQDFTVLVVGYVVMRVAMVGQWLRAAHDDPPSRPVALRYATGILAAQIFWVAWLAVPDGLRVPLFVVGVLCELGTPVWAERAKPTTWHPHHIAERYGLFTIIVLGESVLSATNAVREGLDEPGHAGVYLVALGGLLTVFGLWWIYFARPAHDLLTDLRTSIRWGYSHYLILGAGAAVGAGLEVNVDHVLGKAHLSDAAVGATVTIPVVIFLLVLWGLQVVPRPLRPARKAMIPAGCVLVLAATFSGQAALATGLLLAALIIAGLAVIGRLPAPDDQPA